MAKPPVVPKFGSWDAENIGYTVFFDKVRENKAAPHKPPDTFDADDDDRKSSSRPPSSHRHRDPHRHRPNTRLADAHHRRDGSAASSDTASRGARAEHSKFSPPQQYQPRYNSHPAQGGYGEPAPRVAASSPPRHHAPARGKASAVPKFGVWDEQNAAVAQGFTVQFEKVKKHREVARATVPDVPPHLSPERVAARRRARKNSFLSKIYRCLFPVVRE